MTAGPLVRKYYLELVPPSDADKTADAERVLAGLTRLGLESIDIPLRVAASIPAALRADGYRVTASVAELARPRIIAVEHGDTTSRNFGLAIDLGTTNVVGALIDLNTGTVVAESSEPNPQIAHGEDILNRIHYCLRPGNLEELQNLAAGCINLIAARLVGEAGILSQEINCVSVAGNTTMAHLFLGLDPYNICRAPYVPAANRFGFLRASDAGLKVNPDAVVYVLPNVGSYVGGDVLAGILVSGMSESEDVSLLVDVGTNAEIVVGNRDWLLVCAGAAGPALEGGVVRHGMRAMNGAIERVTIDPLNLTPSYIVIGGARPVGLCGSALIDLLAELSLKGIIDGRGKFVEPVVSDRVVEFEERKAYLVVPAAESGTGSDIVFTELDIDNLVRTKAAMYTALNVVTRELGLSFSDLAAFNIAGTFGQYIAADKAVAIGMVPDIELSRYRCLGNTSLKGAAALLADGTNIGRLERIASMTTYKEMNVSTDFMSEFRAAMFIPHTDSSLFPSLIRK